MWFLFFKHDKQYGREKRNIVENNLEARCNFQCLKPHDLSIGRSGQNVEAGIEVSYLVPEGSS